MSSAGFYCGNVYLILGEKHFRSSSRMIKEAIQEVKLALSREIASLSPGELIYLSSSKRKLIELHFDADVWEKTI